MSQNTPVLTLTALQQEQKTVCTSVGADGVYVVLVLSPEADTPKMYYCTTGLECDRKLKDLLKLDSTMKIQPHEMRDETSARRVNVALQFIAELEILTADDGGDRD